MSEDPKSKIYESIKGLTEALGQAGLYKEEKVDTAEEISSLKSTVKVHSFILVSFFVVAIIAFIGFVIDALYFHVTNNRYFENVNDCRQNFDKINTDIQLLKAKHPEFFR
jgi:hypothetical protein